MEEINMFEYDTPKGEYLDRTIKNIIELARKNNTHVRAIFNEIPIIVNKDSDLQQVREMYMKESRKYILKDE